MIGQLSFDPAVHKDQFEDERQCSTIKNVDINTLILIGTRLKKEKRNAENSGKIEKNRTGIEKNMIILQSNYGTSFCTSSLSLLSNKLDSMENSREEIVIMIPKLIFALLSDSSHFFSKSV